MKKAQILLCDPDAMYLGRLHGYLKEQIRLPVELSDYTDPRFLQDAVCDPEKAILVIAEEALREADCENYKTILVLTETDTEVREAVEEDTAFYTICRYRKASEIADEILRILSERTESVLFSSQTDGEMTKIIGYYSPLRRCMQTSMAIAAGELLSVQARSMYLNFDPFPPEILTGDTQGSLSDLLYYFSCAREKLPVWIQRVKKQIGDLEYIPPAAGFLQTADASGEDWIGLIRAICAEAKPRYLLLDLSEGVSGLPEILSICDVIYTITGEDKHARDKIAAYRRWLAMDDDDLILQKTVFCSLPARCRLPKRPQMLAESTIGRHLRNGGLVPYEAGL